MNFLLHLRQEWDVILKAPFACVLCLVIGFAGGSWYYAEQVATLGSQVAFWKDKATATGPGTPASTPPSAAATAPATAPANSSAHFTMNAEGANFYTSPGDDSLTYIVLDVQIRNSGMPSKATGWRLTVTPKGGAPVVAQYTLIPKDPPLRLGDPPQTLRASDGLADKVLRRPLQYEQLASGRLLFYARLPLAVVQDGATALNLTVQDIAGNPFSTGQLKVGDWLHPRSDSGN